MKVQKKGVGSVFERVFSEKVRHYIDGAVIRIAILGFLLHLLLILLVNSNFFEFPIRSLMLDDYISAIYTPFSFILIYEVYLFIYYLPQSTTISVGKQYEIVSLIVIRRIFKDISNLKLSGNWFEYHYNLQFTFDSIGFLILFGLTFLFYRLNKNRPSIPAPRHVDRFIRYKQYTSLILLPTLFFIAMYSLIHWIIEIVDFNRGAIDGLSNVNAVFYDEFFTLLILVDVFLLLISYRYTEKYSLLIRNSGFIISTILIKVSFAATGILNILLSIAAVGFGVIILWIYNLYEKDESEMKN